MSLQSRDIFLSSFFTGGGILDQKIHSGATDEDLASQYGVSPETIRNWFLRTGFRRRPHARLSQLNMARIVELDGAGFDADAIARQAFAGSISEDMVERALSEMDYGSAQVTLEKHQNQFAPKTHRRRKRKPPPNPSARHKRRSHWTPEQKQQVIELISSGLEPYDVWRITGASKRRQRRIVREFGVSS